MLKLYRNLRMVFAFFPKSEPMVEAHSGTGGFRKKRCPCREAAFHHHPCCASWKAQSQKHDLLMRQMQGSGSSESQFGPV